MKIQILNEQKQTKKGNIYQGFRVIEFNPNKGLFVLESDDIEISFKGKNGNYNLEFMTKGNLIYNDTLVLKSNLDYENFDDFIIPFVGEINKALKEFSTSFNEMFKKVQTKLRLIYDANEKYIKDVGDILLIRHLQQVVDRYSK